MEWFVTCISHSESLLMRWVRLVGCIGRIDGTTRAHCINSELFVCVTVSRNPSVSRDYIPQVSLLVEVFEEPRIGAWGTTRACEVSRKRKWLICALANIVWTRGDEHSSRCSIRNHCLHFTRIAKTNWKFIIGDQLLRIGLYLNNIPQIAIGILQSNIIGFNWNCRFAVNVHLCISLYPGWFRWRTHISPNVVVLPLQGDNSWTFGGGILCDRVCWADREGRCWLTGLNQN